MMIASALGVGYRWYGDVLAMAGLGSQRAIELLIEQASSALGEDRFASAVSVAGRAVRAAEQDGDPSLHIRALQVEADALRMSGDDAAALARCTRILGMVEDPATTAGLDTTATWAVANTYIQWVESARFAGGIAVRGLFGVLDAADRWLTATGHRDWRAGVLLERALTHDWLGELDQAIAAAQEALTAYRPNTPGYTLATHRFQLGDLLQAAGRVGEAEPLYQAILDDPKTNPNDRKGAWQGLAWCALARDDPHQALRHATTAVHTAEPLGDNPLTPALEVLVAAQRAVGDLDAAWHTATRHLQTARRIGTHHRLYYALRDAVDIAIDRADHPTAHTLLTELDHHATALDTDTATTTHTTETTRQRQRLTR
jgi:tetratricopeptide (TPR) repeat protein